MASGELALKYGPGVCSGVTSSPSSQAGVGASVVAGPATAVDGVPPVVPGAPVVVSGAAESESPPPQAARTTAARAPAPANSTCRREGPPPVRWSLGAGSSFIAP